MNLSSGDKPRKVSGADSMQAADPGLDKVSDLASGTPAVMRIADVGVDPFVNLFRPAGLALSSVAASQAIPGSHWGDDEAGLIGCTLYVRDDTPVHSALHEAGHWLLMDADRRANLHTDAGGTAAEEDAVCYLQIVLADKVPGMGRARMLADMDRWGYSFRLGSATRWFTEDAEDARATLNLHAEVLERAIGTLDYSPVVPID